VVVINRHYLDKFTNRRRDPKSVAVLH
jgi:hypothetical protein